MTKKKQGKNDPAWEILFKEHNILPEIEKTGKYIISSETINKVREARLMTKFDHKVNLPEIFKANDLSILPITRGNYIISSFSAYQPFETLPTATTETISIPSHIQSLLPQYIISETIALNCANACGLLNDFLEDETLNETVNGRMSSGNFTFQINSKRGIQEISVNNSQVEIDGAFEGNKFLSLFEAKNEISDDFLIRQLYYPYRIWVERLTKPIKPIFLVFSNGIFHFYEYHFEDPKNYNSLVLIKQKNYAIETRITKEDIKNIIQTVEIIPEPTISFPQADKMTRIINLMELLYDKPMTPEDITTEYAFTRRQTTYYTDAAIYLDLVQKKETEENPILYTLSETGQKIMKMEYRGRQLAIIKQIVEHKVFYEVAKLQLQNNQRPTKKEIIKIMKQSNLYNIEKESTFERRSSTISRWILWIFDSIEKQGDKQ